jgi:hypothetical protein
MTALPKQHQLTARVARRFAWFAVIVAIAAFGIWGATIYDVLFRDWQSAAGAAFCAISLSVIASLLARTAVGAIG